MKKRLGLADFRNGYASGYDEVEESITPREFLAIFEINIEECKMVVYNGKKLTEDDFDQPVCEIAEFSNGHMIPEYRVVVSGVFWLPGPTQIRYD